MAVKGLYEEVSIEIAAPPEVVYGLVTDVGRMGDWSPENEGAEWVEGGSPPAEGDKFLGHNAREGRQWSVPCTVTVARTDEEFAFHTAPDTDEGPYAHWTYRVAPSATGSMLTEVWDVLALPPTLADMTDEQLAARQKVVRAGIQTTLEGIKSAAES